MAIINAVLVNQLVAGNGGHTISVADSGQSLLVDNKPVNLVPLISASTTASSFTPNELESFSRLDATRQTTIYNLINALVATAIASGVAVAQTLFNTSPGTAAFMTKSLGSPSDAGPAASNQFGYTYGYSQVIANELNPVEAPRNPSSLRP